MPSLCLVTLEALDRPLPSLALISWSASGVLFLTESKSPGSPETYSLCVSLFVVDPYPSVCIFCLDQDHLNKEIEKIRKQLKVKVNRLFEAQGIGLGELKIGGKENRMMEEPSSSLKKTWKGKGGTAFPAGQRPRRHMSVGSVVATLNFWGRPAFPERPWVWQQPGFCG